ncbi:Uma2 family endonuclease [Nocardiopsis sp. MT53]|uniref:Uma2 family endonuclease n=2 Tax=Nocardiopsidaceae TaxID=83676 RepID=A0ABX8BN55_9ACTN|nr:Uma2 family endonuclease [Nocardiopsis changdeensis]QYX39618.1 Uma2 family endonuclease [Nocardiopsis sp. MT53]
MATVGDENDPMIGDEMSAPTVARAETAGEPLPWSLLQPPPGGFTAEDLDRIPDLPPHTELIDGSLVLVSPQKLFHMLVMDVLRDGLKATVPDHLKVAWEFSVVLAERQRPEPDVLVVRKEAFARLEQTWFPPEAVELVVEVVSPESVDRDRERKPQLYAKAGIPHFWRVEQEGDEAVVYAHELDPARGEYGKPSIHRKRLELSAPYPVDIDLSDILNR